MREVRFARAYELETRKHALRVPVVVAFVRIEAERLLARVTRRERQAYLVAQLPRYSAAVWWNVVEDDAAENVLRLVLHLLNDFVFHN